MEYSLGLLTSAVSPSDQMREEEKEGAGADRLGFLPTERCKEYCGEKKDYPFQAQRMIGAKNIAEKKKGVQLINSIE